MLKTKNIMSFLKEYLIDSEIIKFEYSNSFNNSNIKLFTNEVNNYIYNSDFTIKNIDYKGKFIYFECIFYTDSSSNIINTIYIGNHLGLSGYWSDIEDSKKNYYKRITIHFKKDNINYKLFFYDKSKTARFILLYKFQLIDELSRIGIDVYSKSFNYSNFAKILTRINNLSRPIADVLLDQRIFSGLNPNLISDILYLSKIHPSTYVLNINNNTVNILYKSIYNILYNTLASSNGYIWGLKKDYHNNLVFKIAVNNHMFFYVPNIQLL